jgi:hypothetical protein
MQKAQAAAEFDIGATKLNHVDPARRSIRWKALTPQPLSVSAILKIMARVKARERERERESSYTADTHVV